MYENMKNLNPKSTFKIFIFILKYFIVIGNTFRVDLLGPFMQLLEFISVDKDLKNHLAWTATSHIPTTSQNLAITNKDVPKVFTYLF